MSSKPQPTPVQTYSFKQVKEILHIPDNYGENVTVGILAWGDYGMIGVDVQAIVKDLENKHHGVPTFHKYVIGKQINNESTSGELFMDCSIIAHFLPKATVNIYMAEPQDAAQTLLAAIDDGCDVTTCSFGVQDTSYVADFEKALEIAKSKKMVTCFASGDSGAGSGTIDSVVFPAGHKDALAVGAIFVPKAAPPQPTTCGNMPIGKPQVWWNYPNPDHIKNRSWWASGGGVSGMYGVPGYQQSINPTSYNGSTGRGVPDVAAFGQGLTDCVGTSAATPTVASLMACVISAYGSRIDNIHKVLYEASPGSGAYKSITIGCNVPPEGQNNAGNGYTAQTGWDACTGLGILNGEKLLAVLQGS